jgi:predicted ATPase
MEQALKLLLPERQSNDGHLLRYVRDPAVHIRGTLSWILWYLGLPEQSRALSEEALYIARNAADPFGLALSLILAAELHQRRGESEQVLKYASAALELSIEHGFPLYLSWATILRGRALGRQGSSEEGVALICRGLEAHEATGAALGRPSLLGMLADVYGRAGRPEAALRVIGEALALVARTGETFDEPTLMRLQAELMLQPSGNHFRSSLSAIAEEAETWLQTAIMLARHQAAKSIELQCALSLARLWLQQGKASAVRHLMIKIHGSFTEGTDTIDLRQASELLEKMRAWK